ncbi:MBL fold metallo-hydrolase [Mesorhizobium sp. J18]|uniref:MBL fold metallo-hydrolase n=1 Tax=Mesorhizobium sp. J18 TaxID=935263 RepID=UPI001648D386|nr:MBL fold metallo-hydrolase [Mesorhizobium sp. J18]
MSGGGPSYDVLVSGNSYRFEVGGIGISNTTLIHTADGPIIFDLGSHVTRDMIKLGLSKRGLNPSDIPRVFLSHLHFDHVMNIDLFPHTTEVFVSRREWDYCSNPHPEDDWLPWGIKEQLEKYRLRLVDGTDELSSGVRYFPAPGHTPGCYAVALDLADGRKVTLAGDAVKFPREAIRMKADHSFDTKEVASQSIRTIMEMSDVVVPGHFGELFKEDGRVVWEAIQPLNLIAR